MRYTITINTLLAILLLNCSTPYQKKGWLGGYSEEQIQDRIYLVTFDGNQHTSINKVQKYLLYRCAEITIANGFDYFQIIDEEFYTKVKSVRPEARTQGKTVSDGMGGKKFVVVPNFSNSTKSTSSENTLLIQMIDKITIDNYHNTFDAHKLMINLENDVFSK